MSEGFVLTSATDVNDLLNQIVGQAVARGWAQQYLERLGTIGRRAHISKDGVVINLASALDVQPVPSNREPANLTRDTIIPAADRNNQDWTWYFSTYNANVGNYYASPGYLCISAGTGFDSGLAWYSQPGADYESEAARNRGTFQCAKTNGAIGKAWMFFYENPAAILVIWEAKPGYYQWVAAGNLEKDTEFNGGQFYGASHSMYNPGNSYPGTFANIQVRVNEAAASKGRANGWAASYVVQADYNAYPDDRNVPQVPGYTQYSYTIQANPNLGSPGEPQRSYDAVNGRVWLHPVRAYAVRSDVGYSYVGVVGDLHYSTTRAFVGGETVDLGGEQYMMFPFNMRVSPYNWDVGGNDTTPGWYTNNTYGAGMAVRKPQ